MLGSGRKIWCSPALRWPAVADTGRAGHLVKRSFSLSGHRTSVALEPEFWTALQDEAAEAVISLAALVVSVDAARAPGHPLASALRVHALAQRRILGR